MAFSFIAVTLGKEIVILGIQKLSFGRPGASILASSEPFCQLGDALGDHGSSRNDTLGSETDFSDFGMILGVHFERFLGLDKSTSVFLLGLVPRSLFASIFKWNY